jgi:hypothetical protein
MSFLLRQVASDRMNFEERGLFCLLILAALVILATFARNMATSGRNSDKNPGPTLPIKRSSKRCANSSKHCVLERVPEKLLAFFDSDMLQLFDFE